MSRNRPATRARLLALLIAVPLVAMLLAATAMAAPNKPVVGDISPVQSNDFNIAADDIAAGTCVQFRFSLANDTKTQQLGSANVTLDPDLTYNGNPLLPCAVAATGPFVGTTPRGTLNVTGVPDAPLVELRGLSAVPGETVHFTFWAFVDCTTVTPFVFDGFSFIPKQANNYSGDPGNNMTATGDMDVRAVGLCETFDATETASGSIDGSAANSEYTVEALNAAAGTLILAKGVNSIDCTGYNEHTDTVTVDFNGATEKILTFSFPNSTHEQKTAFRVCFASPDDWTDRSGTLVTSDTAASLLPDCNSTTAPTNLPCMLPVKIQGQTVTIKAWLRPGDPPGKG